LGHLGCVAVVGPPHHVPVFTIWYGLQTTSYLIGLSAFAVLAACIFVYWHIHQRIDGYRQKAGIYRQVVYVVLALPAMIYSLFGYIYRDF
jgi:hypothetical protein